MGVDRSPFFFPTLVQNKEPTFTSFQPPSIAADREPDAVIDVPPNVVGWVIGKAGIRINEIQQRTDAAVRLVLQIFQQLPCINPCRRSVVKLSDLFAY